MGYYSTNITGSLWSVVSWKAIVRKEARKTAEGQLTVGSCPFSVEIAALRSHLSDLRSSAFICG